MVLVRFIRKSSKSNILISSVLSYKEVSYVYPSILIQRNMPPHKSQRCEQAHIRFSLFSVLHTLYVLDVTDVAKPPIHMSDSSHV